MRNTTLTLALAAGLAASLPAHATLIDRGGGLIYDDVLNITWLQNANLAASNTFGLAYNTDLGDHPGDSFGSKYPELISSDGSMNWGAALWWIDAMNTANYLGYSDWRLPTLSPGPLNAFGNYDFSNNGTQARGYGATGSGYGTATPAGGWGPTGDADGIWSEMGWMYYHNLGNLGYCTPDDGDPTACTSQTGHGLANTGLFDHLESYVYWSGLEYAPYTGNAWVFSANVGYQDAFSESSDRYAWAVRPGDVAAAPEPATLGLLGLGLAGLGWARGRRRG